jgi:hypothetical protein
MIYVQISPLDLESVMRDGADGKPPPYIETERNRFSGLLEQASETAPRDAPARKRYAPSPTYFPKPLATFVK